MSANPTRPLIEGGIPRFPRLKADRLHLLGTGTGSHILFFWKRESGGRILVAVPGRGSIVLQVEDLPLTADEAEARGLCETKMSPGVENLTDLVNDTLARGDYPRYGVYIAEHCDGESDFGPCPQCGAGTHYINFSDEPRRVCPQFCRRG